MQKNTNEVLLLYSIQKSETVQLDMLVDVQAYPIVQSYSDEYDSITMIVHGSRWEEAMLYEILKDASTLSDLKISELDRLIVQGENNGYVYAAGVWQIDWSTRQKRYIFKCVCATDIDLVEVTELLPDGTMKEVAQAIQQAAMFLRERFDHCVLISWDEEAYGFIQNEQSLSVVGRQTWYMVWNCFLPEATMICHLSVSFHPQTPDGLFTVRLIDEERNI